LLDLEVNSVSASRKLFIAAVLLATGLVVAYLLGEPAAIKQALDHSKQKFSSPQAVVAPVQLPSSTPWSANRVQLLPEPAVVQSQSFLSVPAKPSLQSPLVPIPSVPMVNASNEIPQFHQSVAVNNAPAIQRSGGAAPLAKLRNEAPRPIGNEPRSPATIRHVPQEFPENGGVVSSGDVYKTMAPASPPPLILSTAFLKDTGSTATTTTMGDMASDATGNKQSTSSPWPAVEATTEPRTHVVSDGDSLDKLAGLYLDDPQRSSEIFALNRELLTNPDLLPIGMELKIPERINRASSDRQGRRAGFPNDSAVREAASGNLVPVRPISSYDNVIPRAQLAPPVAAE
jgi:hypothetical protein